MLLRYAKLGMRMTAFSTFWGLAVLIPCYYTSDPNQPAYGFYRYTLSNVAQGSTRLWWSVGFAYMYTCHALHLIRKEYEHLLTWRQDWLAHGVADTPAQPRYSIVVERLPRDLRSDTALRAHFERLFPAQVHSAVVCMELSDLEVRAMTWHTRSGRVDHSR